MYCCESKKRAVLRPCILNKAEANARLRILILFWSFVTRDATYKHSDSLRESASSFPNIHHFSTCIATYMNQKLVSFQVPCRVEAGKRQTHFLWEIGDFFSCKGIFQVSVIPSVCLHSGYIVKHRYGLFFTL